jgi:hypothetical protein
MRQLAVLGTFAVVAAGGGLLLAGRPTRAQQATTPSVPDSVAAVALAAGDTASLPGPRQPIFFRHDIHAGQYKIDCQYCHYSVTVSSEPGIPSVQTCMGCHAAIAGTDSSARREIRKLRTFWNNREKPDSAKLEWTRIHTLARHVRFPHSVHVKAMGTKACGTCHGDVARMPQVFETNNVNNMGFCISCHLQRDVKRDCSVCHY